MGSGATAKYALQYPLGTDAPNVPGDVAALAQAVDAIFVGFAPDNTVANRPAVGKSGRMFVESAASLGLPGTMWREDGATWRSMGSRIQPNAAGDIGQIIRATAGQTADMVHVEDSLGNPYFKIGNNGATSITPGGGSTAAQALLAQAGPAGQRAIVAKMAAAPTVNAVEVQDSTSAVLAHVSPSGYIRTSGKIQAGSLTDVASVTLAVINAFGGGTVGAIVRGAVGGTGDLQQWQDSTGVAKSSISATGIYNVSGIAYIGDTGQTTTTLLRAGVATNTAVVVQGAASQTGDLTDWTNSAGVVLGSVANTGRLNANAGAVINNAQNTAQTALFVQNSGVTTTLTSAFRRTLSQTADITQWQDNAGAPIASVDSTGAFNAFGTGVQATLGSNDLKFNRTSPSYIQQMGIGGYLGIRGSVASAGDTEMMVLDPAQGVTIGGNRSGGSQMGTGVTRLMVRAINSQTVDLQQWLNGSGTPVALIDKQGSFMTGAAGGTNQVSINKGLFGGNVSLFVGAGGIGRNPIIVQGESGQTANLQEWQNNSGAKGAFIDQLGMFHQVTQGSSVGTRFSNNANNSDLRFSSTADGLDYVVIGVGGSLFQSVSTGVVPIKVQAGHTGQAVDLFQCLNPAGNFVSGFDSGGRLYSAPFTPGTNPLWRVDAGAAFSPPSSTGTALGLVQVTGNTADNMQVLNLSNAVIMRISTTGNVQGTGAYTTLSDESVKTNVGELRHDPMQVMRRLRPVHFDYIGGDRDQVGFIANEVEPVLPHAVRPWDHLYGGIPDHDGRLGLQTDAILAYAVGAIQNIDKRLAALEARAA